jgi:tripartite-type tricarboxylate transporter receptor subunit TctC
MNDMTRRAVFLALCFAIATAMHGALAQGVAQGSPVAVTQQYPVKPVRMIVPLAPGGGSDIVGRIVALELGALWGQSVVVDNRPGAGSVVGTAMVVKSPADGYTLLVSSSSLAISPALYKNLDFDVQRDLAAVTLLASQPSILAVQASVPATSVKELIALAKAQPGTLKYGSAGTGSATHLGSELLKYAAGIDLLHIPYRSAGQATASLLAGETQILLTNMASVLPHVKSGRIRVLGISSFKRSALAPDVPTIAESGLAGFEYATWYGMLAPAGTPKPLVDRLQADTAKVIGTPHGRERLTAQGLEVYGSTPEEFRRYLSAEIKKWSKVVQAARLRVE